MLTDYTFYTGYYNGKKVGLQEFPSLLLKAELEFKNYTLKSDEIINKVMQGKHNQAVQITLCEMIDNLKDYEELIEHAKKAQTMEVMGIASETVKDHTVSLRDKGNSVDNLDKLIQDRNIKVMQKYLYPSGLLYRGMRVL